MNITAHKAELEAAGYKLVGEVAIADRMGIIVAENHPHGFWCKDAVVEAILAQPVEIKRVRARTDEGKFIADDPATPDVNEAWVTKAVKKVRKKK